MRSDTITLSLKCPFSPEKLRDMADKLTRAINTREEIEEEKKASNAAFKSRLEECEKEIVPLARAYAKSYEMADVLCDIRYNDPEPGKKTYYRMAPSEAVETHDMTWEEKQEEIQFNLPQDGAAPAESVTPPAADVIPGHSASELESLIGDVTPCSHPSVSNLHGTEWKCDACGEVLTEPPTIPPPNEPDKFEGTAGV